MGFAQLEIMKGLARLMDLELHRASLDLPSLQLIVQESLARLLSSSPNDRSHSQQLTYLLVNL